MSRSAKYVPFFVSAMLMGVVLFLIYPHYQYYVDPDGTAYLTISQRYANGDYFKAVNGYWSPWSCWLTAIGIKLGMAAIPASVVVNALGAAGFLCVSHSFFLRFELARQMQWLFNITLALFLCFAIFWQSFDDLWECFFLLGTLRIMLAHGFKSRPGLWVLCGVVGALAYFAKAYSFPFFILNTVCCVYFLSRDNKGQWLKISAVAISVMIICSMPWIVILHEKYRVWTTSTSGSLNTSWYLVGHPYWKDGIQHLIPPFYNDSPSYWEDPYQANGSTPHFWDSWHLFGLQILRVGLNCWKLLRSMLEISIFFPLTAVLLGRFLLVARKKTELVVLPNFTLALSFLLFPLGYMLVNFESRYIWFMLPIGMLAGGLFILNHLSSNEGVKILRIVPYLFALSFLGYPAFKMCKMYDEGKSEYELAQQMRAANMHGTFASNARPGLEAQRLQRIAYFSGLSLCSNITTDVTEKELLKEMHRYNVNYFIVYHDPTFKFELRDAVILDENGQTAQGSYNEMSGFGGVIRVYSAMLK